MKQVSEGIFCAPWMYIGDFSQRYRAAFFHPSFYSPCFYDPACILQRKPYLIAASVWIFHGKFYIQKAISVIIRQIRLYKQILHMDFRYTVKIYRPENPCKTEEILILNPAGTAALVNAHLQPVYAGMKSSRKLILRRCKAVLAIPCKLTVTPHIKGCFHSLERHKHPFFQKIFLLICDNKFPYIAPGRSILPVNGRRAKL